MLFSQKRRVIIFCFTLIVIPLVTLVAGYSIVLAQVARQVTVTAVVPQQPPLEEPDTIIIFRGISYPSSTLTINQDGLLLVELTTDAQAAFDVSAIVMPGTHTFTILGRDSDGLIGKESNFTLTLSSGTITTISGIFLGPTITVDKNSLTSGETATVSGTTAPNSEVNVTLSSGGFGQAAGLPHTAVQIANADGNGRWLQLYNADDLAAGTYNAKAQAVEPVSRAVSEFSNTVAFEVIGTKIPDECSDKVIADINCDGFVNLIDFSILLFYWESSNPANARADINSNGIVNIVDFSIMMYYWTG